MVDHEVGPVGLESWVSQVQPGTAINHINLAPAFADLKTSTR